ncbi:unnamed protein product [Urochloa humidicola]
MVVAFARRWNTYSCTGHDAFAARIAIPWPNNTTTKGAEFPAGWAGHRGGALVQPPQGTRPPSLPTSKLERAPSWRATAAPPRCEEPLPPFAVTGVRKERAPAAPAPRPQGRAGLVQLQQAAPMAVEGPVLPPPSPSTNPDLNLKFKMERQERGVEVRDGAWTGWRKGGGGAAASGRRTAELARRPTRTPPLH